MESNGGQPGVVELTPVDYSRQQEFVPTRLKRSPIAVVGAGTTGGWVVMMLVRMGFTDITVFDSDSVESHNIPAQFHSPLSVGLSKTGSLRTSVLSMGFPAVFHSEEEVTEFTDLMNFKYVFSCVDSIPARRVVAEKVFKDQGELVDLRMGLEAGCVLFCPPLSHAGYLRTLEVEMSPEPACGRRALLTDGLALTSNVLAMWLHSKRTGERLPQRWQWWFGSGRSEEQQEE